MNNRFDSDSHYIKDVDNVQQNEKANNLLYQCNKELIRDYEIQSVPQLMCWSINWLSEAKAFSETFQTH